MKKSERKTANSHSPSKPKGHIELYDVLNCFPKAYDFLPEERREILDTFWLDEKNNLLNKHTVIDSHISHYFIWSGEEWLKMGSAKDSDEKILDEKGLIAPDITVKYPSLNKIKFIDFSKSGTINKYHPKFQPSEIETDLISTSVRSFCKKWNLDVKVISLDDLRALDNLYDNRDHSHEGEEENCNCGEKKKRIYFEVDCQDHNNEYIVKHKGKNLCAIDYYPPNELDSCIYIATESTGNANSLVLMNLAVYLLKLNPELADIHTVPTMALWLRFVQELNVPVKSIQSDPSMSEFVEAFGFSSIKDFVNYFDSELIELGLLNVDRSITFDQSKVLPKISWVKDIYF